MKQTILVFSLTILIAPQNFFAMDFDQEDGIPLQTIYRQKKNSKKSLAEQLALFDAEIDAQVHRQDSLTADYYFAQLARNIPEIFAEEKTIEKFAQNTDSLFGNSVQLYVEQAHVNHYKKVTCDTLATITNPSVQQPLKILNNLPIPLKKYIMQKGYDEINESYSCFELSDNINSFDINSKAHLAATSNNHDCLFQLWDLTTKRAETIPKKSVCGGVKFSSNGDQLITVTLAQTNATTVDIDIWDTLTKSLIHTVQTPTLLNYFSLENESTEFSTLILLDQTSNLSLYRITKNAPPALLLSVKTQISSIQPIKLWGNYSLARNPQKKLVIKKKCTAYFLCLQAIRNTERKESLENIYATLPYATLDQQAKQLINAKIKEKIMLPKTEHKKTVPHSHHLFTWFK